MTTQIDLKQQLNSRCFYRGGGEVLMVEKRTSKGHDFYIRKI